MNSGLGDSDMNSTVLSKVRGIIHFVFNPFKNDILHAEAAVPIHLSTYVTDIFTLVFDL